MKNYFDKIKEKLRNKIKFENIEIVDNSYKHIKHKSFLPEKYHLELKIKSIYLNSLPRINAQKIVMKVLEEDLKKKNPCIGN